jgi:D-glycero-D-manno-heptose 1,7-bisphosphate phosphatase
MRPAVFLDRDGTLIEEVGYLDRFEQIRLFPYSVEAVRMLNRAGFAVVVATNQSGVARGFFDEAFVGAVHERLGRWFGDAGARIDGFYYCPHHPEGPVPAYQRACECRKPRPGLLRRAASDLDLDLARSFVVGDRANDIEAGRAVGAAGVLVMTGYGMSVEPDARTGARAVTNNLIEAVGWVLRRGSRDADRGSRG